jgi:hypothetical protein
MIKFSGYPFLEKEDHAFNVPGLSLVLRSDSIQLLKWVPPSSRESDEARLAHSSCFWDDSRDRNAAQQHGGERVPHRHERCSPDANRVHWAARGAVCDWYVFSSRGPEVVG